MNMFSLSCHRVLLSLLVLLPALACAQIEALDDSELGGIAAQQGIAIQMDLFLNMTPDSSKTAVPNNDAAPFDSSCGTGGPGTLGNPCRFGLQFANRTSDWLVFKDFYMGARIFQINLDGDTIGNASPAGSVYFDATRFQNVAGTCLLPGGCTVANMNGLNAIVLSYPATSTSYNTVSKASSGYNSLLMTANLGRLVVEADTGSGPPDTTMNSYLGARVSDNVSQFAGMAIRGKAYVFGF